MIQTATTSRQITIFKSNPSTNYAKIPNEELQNRLKGDKSPSATEVYFYLKSLPPTWDISTENVARHYKVTTKCVQRLFKIIIDNGKMSAEQTKKKNGRFGKIIYRVFSNKSPEVEKRPPVKLVSNDPEILEKIDDSPEDKKRPPVTYIKKENKKEYKNNTKPMNQPPKNPTKQPPETKSKKRLAADLFTNRQILKMGRFADSISSSCKKIYALPAKGPIRRCFNPVKAAAMSISDGKQPGAIDETLKSMIGGWDSIDEPWAIYTAQLKIKNQNWNESELIRQHNERTKNLNDWLNG